MNSTDFIRTDLLAALRRAKCRPNRRWSWLYRAWRWLRGLTDGRALLLCAAWFVLVVPVLIAMGARW